MLKSSSAATLHHNNQIDSNSMAIAVIDNNLDASTTQLSFQAMIDKLD
jgi:hypothetical protein